MKSESVRVAPLLAVLDGNAIGQAKCVGQLNLLVIPLNSEKPLWEEEPKKNDL